MPLPGIEPGLVLDERTVLPLNYRGTSGMSILGIEPRSLAWRASILPLHYIDALPTGFEPVRAGAHLISNQAPLPLGTMVAGVVLACLILAYYDNSVLS